MAKKPFKKAVMDLAVKLYFKLTNSSLKQRETAGEGGACDARTSALFRRAAGEGAVLLKNDGTLPLSGKLFALFGRTQTDTFYTGYGSGGDVWKPYHVCILDGLKASGARLCAATEAFYTAYSKAHPADRGVWGDWPYSFPEPEVPASVLQAASAETDTAVVVLGRAAGEDRDAALAPGSYLLSEAEENLLAAVKQNFAHVAVVLNIGGIMDLSFTEDARISAALLLFQGGMETGNACADLLLGKCSPCGKLPDTVARSYEDHPSSKNFGGPFETVYAEDLDVGYRYFETKAPDRVLYPFGFGLSYTTFALSDVSADREGVACRVTNTGARSGKTALEVYVKKPEGSPARELIGFKKTALLRPGESEELRISFSRRDFAVADLSRRAFVMPAGTYALYVGFDVRTADMVASFTVNAAEFVEEFSDILQADLKETVLKNLPREMAGGGERISFSEVASGKKTLEAFVAGLTDRELCDLSRGALKMDSPLGASGNAGVMGGVTKRLAALGIPAVTMTDGPSGIRLKTACSLIPSGTLLAATFDEALMFDVYRALGEEMKARGSDVLLAPGMNLHRNPLCGRNFEYFSEDPYLTGKMAAAAVKGLQSTGRAACPKHFACNNQEFNRNKNNSVVSERALRELYLRAFEIVVKEAAPKFLMTSYNLVNGVYAHYHYALVRGILRKEWGFGGCIVTDWWMQKGKSPDFKHIKNNAYRIRAGVNVLMPGGGYLGKRVQGGSPLSSLGKREGLTRGELQRNAAEILATILQLSASE